KPTPINDIGEATLVLNTVKPDTALSFEGLFIEKYKPYIPQFIDILRSDTYSNNDGKSLDPLINSTDKWTGNKQAAHLFYKLLLKESIVKNATSRKIGDIFNKR